MVYFESFSDFIAMGGHGAFVWPCYLIVSIALVAQFISAKNAVNSAKQQIAVFYRRQSAQEIQSDDLHEIEVHEIHEGTK